jgi:hypothetical protein
MNWLKWITGYRVRGGVERREKMRAEMRARLAPLRPVFVASGDAKRVAFFDELLEQHEFEVALHVICDYLLEAKTPAASVEVIRVIAELHEVMEIEDGCVRDLRGKAGAGESGGW